MGACFLLEQNVSLCRLSVLQCEGQASSETEAAATELSARVASPLLVRESVRFHLL